MPKPETPTPEVAPANSPQLPMVKFWTLKRSPRLKHKKIEFAGAELAWARLEAERLGLLTHAGYPFVLAGLVVSIGALGCYVSFMFPLNIDPWVGPLAAVLFWVFGMLLLTRIIRFTSRQVRQRRLAKTTKFLPPELSRRLIKQCLRWSWLIVGAYYSLFVVAGAASGDPLHGIFAGFMILPLLGYAVVYQGLFGASGREPCCAKCNYSTGNDPDTWTVCPECGLDLVEGIGVVLGQRFLRPWRVTLGITIVWAGHLGFILLTS